MVAQKINIKYKQIDAAIAYYKMLCSLNNIDITDRQVQLLAFTAIKGGITNPAAREEFCKTYSSSKATINNMISVLRRKHLFIKDKNKIKVNPVIALDFTEPIIVKVTISYDNAG